MSIFAGKIHRPFRTRLAHHVANRPTAGYEERADATAIRPFPAPYLGAKGPISKGILSPIAPGDERTATGRPIFLLALHLAHCYHHFRALELEKAEEATLTADFGGQVEGILNAPSPA
jgi:hypothetical protein